MARFAALPVVSKDQYETGVVTPYRLDLTVSALRRLSTNTVDVLTGEGEYLRALDGFCNPVLVRVAQVRPTTLAVTLEGCDGPEECLQARAIVRRILGVERELSQFYRAAKGIPWLWPLAVRMRGLKPPRYPTLWEACVNAIVFQQVSLSAASSIAKRMIAALGLPLKSGDIVPHGFPSAERLRVADDDILRAAGLSTNRLATLRRLADAAVVTGDPSMKVTWNVKWLA